MYNVIVYFLPGVKKNKNYFSRPETPPGERLSTYVQSAVNVWVCRTKVNAIEFRSEQCRVLTRRPAVVISPG